MEALLLSKQHAKVRSRSLSLLALCDAESTRLFLSRRSAWSIATLQPTIARRSELARYFTKPTTDRTRNCADAFGSHCLDHGNDVECEGPATGEEDCGDGIDGDGDGKVDCDDEDCHCN